MQCEKKKQHMMHCDLGIPGSINGVPHGPPNSPDDVTVYVIYIKLCFITTFYLHYISICQFSGYSWISHLISKLLWYLGNSL